jgi:hypothetical protein
MSNLVVASAHINEAQIEALRKDFKGIEREIPRAIGAATRRTTDTARSRMVKGVTQDLNVQAKKLYQRGNARRPIRQRFTRSNRLIIGGQITVAGRIDDTGKAVTEKESIGRIPMAEGRFGIRALKRGISYRIFKTGPRKKLTTPDEAHNMTTPFIARMKSGFVAAFRRHRGSGKLALLHGPSTPHVAQRRPAIRALLKVDAQAIYEKNMVHELTFRMNKHRRNRATGRVR